MKAIYIFNESSTAAEYGIGSFLDEYLKVLKTIKDLEIHVVHMTKTEKFSITREDGISCYRFPYTSGYKGLVRMMRFHIVNSSEIIFHFNYLSQDKLAELLKIHYPLAKTIFSVHYNSWIWSLDGKTEAFKRIIKCKGQKRYKQTHKVIIDDYEKQVKFFNNTDVVICLSEDTYDLLESVYKIPSDKLIFIPNGLKDCHHAISERKQNALREKYQIQKDETILLFVGRVTKTKGVHDLIDSFREIVKQYSSCRLVIIGSGDFNSCFKRGKDIWGKIIFTGHLSQKELREWYLIADIGCMPSYSEECSYVGMEMMMHGLPIVASDARGVARMFQHNSNSLVASIGHNTKELSRNVENEIKILLKSPDTASRIGKQARKDYLKFYSADKMKNAYKQLVENL